jgi:hypothetical protein
VPPVRPAAIRSDKDCRIDLGRLEPSNTARFEDADDDADGADNGDDGKTGCCPLAEARALRGNWLTAANIGGVNGTACV